MEIKKQKCNQCEYKWISRVENPITCPKCKRHDWYEENKKEKMEKRKQEIVVGFEAIKNMSVGEVNELSKKTLNGDN